MEARRWCKICRKPTENRIGSNNWCPCSFCVADTTLVNPSPSPVSRQPCSSPAVNSSANATTYTCVASPVKTVETDGLHALWESLQQRNVSGKATASILNSWSDRNKMQEQYKLYIKQWMNFFNIKWQADSCDPPLAADLDFLVYCHEKGLTYTTLFIRVLSVSCSLLLWAKLYVTIRCGVFYAWNT